MSKRTVMLKINSDAIEIPEDFPNMRQFAGDFYEKLSETGIELNEGIDELSVRERAMSLFLCG